MNRKLVALRLSLGACTPAQAASYNLSNDPDNFRVGDGEYKKHYLGISDNTTYFVGQMDPASVDTYHYKVQFRPEELLSDINAQVSGGNN
jgi:hypothetical protein|nr:MAG TPA: hypothetical protein [Caudoviricetes sp.]